MGEKGQGASASLADKGGETCARTNEARSAAGAVEVARRGIVLGKKETHFLRIEGDAAVFFDKAGDTDPAVLLHCVESGVRVAQFQKAFEMKNVRTEVDDLEARIVFGLFVHCNAVGARGHAIDFDHDAECFEINVRARREHERFGS